MKLIRDSASINGIFGQLFNDDDSLFCQTLERAYLLETGNGPIFAPKIPPGAYLCVRGEHQLEHMTEPFMTFEITGVPNHTGCLFHKGNWETDSIGCVLLGMIRQGTVEILESKIAFDKFMELMTGVDCFPLTVI